MPAKPKTYPLEIFPVSDEGGGVLEYMSKGHHPPEEFTRVLYEEYEKVPRERGVSQVHHLLFRCAPDYTGAFRFLYMEASERGRGVFPVTLVHV